MEIKGASNDPKAGLGLMLHRGLDDATTLFLTRSLAERAELEDPCTPEKRKAKMR